MLLLLCSVMLPRYWYFYRVYHFAFCVCSYEWMPNCSRYRFIHDVSLHIEHHDETPSNEKWVYLNRQRVCPRCEENSRMFWWSLQIHYIYSCIWLVLHWSLQIHCVYSCIWWVLHHFQNLWSRKVIYIKINWKKYKIWRCSEHFFWKMIPHLIKLKSWVKTVCFFIWWKRVRCLIHSLLFKIFVNSIAFVCI